MPLLQTCHGSPLKEISIPSFLREWKLLTAKLQETLSDQSPVGWQSFRQLKQADLGLSKRTIQLESSEQMW